MQVDQTIQCATNIVQPYMFIYDSQFKQAADILNDLKAESDEALITQIYPLRGFKKMKLS